MTTKTHPFARHNLTEDYCKARRYTSPGRASAAAKKMFGSRCWWRVIDVRGTDAEFVIDTMVGYLAD